MDMKQPNMMTVREVAKTGLLSEHALRIMLKAGKLPAIYIGKKALINYDKLCEQLSALGEDAKNQSDSIWY
jgi:excisionase family DNA binding protein